MPGIHHLHVRKRIYQNLEKYPHPIKWKRFFEHLLVSIAIFAPIMSLPQIIKIYYYKNPIGVSTLTFSLLAAFNVLWIAYGIIHKEKAIITTFTMWFIANSSIAIGTLIY